MEIIITILVIWVWVLSLNLNKFRKRLEKLESHQSVQETKESTISQNLSKDAIIKEKTPKEYQVKIPEFLTEHIFAKIGGLAIVLAIGFFLKDSIKNPYVVTSAIYTLSGLLILASFKLNIANKYIKQTLIGIGFAGLYLNTYAAYDHFNIFNNFTAVFVMAAVIISSVYLSLKLDSQVIAIFGSLGAFLLPILTSTESNTLNFMYYLTVINMANSVIFYKKQWSYNSIFNIVFTLLLFINISPLLTTDNAFIYIILVLAIFCANVFADYVKQDKVFYEFSIVNFIGSLIAVYVIVDNQYRDITTLALGLIYFIPFIIDHIKKHKERYDFTYYSFLSFIISLAFAFSNETLVICLVALSFIAYTIFIFNQKDYMQKITMLILSSAVIYHITELYQLEYYSSHLISTPIFNMASLSIICIALSGFIFYFINKYKFNVASSSFLNIAIFATVVFISNEINLIAAYIKDNSDISMRIVSTNQIYAQLLLILSLIYKVLNANKEKVRIIGFGLYITFSLAVIFISIITNQLLLPVFNLHVLLLVCLMALTYKLSKSHELRAWKNILTYFALTIGVYIICNEAYTYANSSLANTVSTSLLFAYSSIILFIGYTQENKIFRTFAFVTLACLIIKLFFHDLADLNGLYRVIILAISGTVLITLSNYINKVSK